MNDLGTLQVGIWLAMDDTMYIHQGMEDLLPMGDEVVTASGSIIAEVKKDRKTTPCNLSAWTLYPCGLHGNDRLVHMVNRQQWMHSREEHVMSKWIGIDTPTKLHLINRDPVRAVEADIIEDVGNRVSI